MTKGPRMVDETERGQLIPQSFSEANKVVAAHYRVTLLNSRESGSDLRGADKSKPPVERRRGTKEPSKDCQGEVWDQEGH